MNTLNGKHIILGISGGIAAYKSAELTRRLRDAGAVVRVVMTHGATEFVTPLTFQALSGNPVHTELLDEDAEAGMGHIELARWADAILIAPASANCMARLAQASIAVLNHNREGSVNGCQGAPASASKSGYWDRERKVMIKRKNSTLTIAMIKRRAMRAAEAVSGPP